MSDKAADSLRFGGVEHPIKFQGWDQGTYRHTPGCLAYGNHGGACQCGALDRTSRIYATNNGVMLLVPPSVWNTSGHSDANADPARRALRPTR